MSPEPVAYGAAMGEPAVWWLRRDLRLTDQPALLAAAAERRPVAALFVVDPVLWRVGTARTAYLLRSLRDLDDALGGRLHVRHGDPAVEVVDTAREVGAASVHLAADFGPYGSARDTAVERALAADGRRLERTGSPYAVAPGRITKDDGTAYRVFTPFYRAWRAHGWRGPAPDPADPVRWVSPEAPRRWPQATAPEGVVLPEAGERAALRRWREFLASEGPAHYAATRDRPDLPGTTQLSAALRWGEVHPRTLLADLDDSPGAEALRRQLAWREFYADVLARRPDSARADLRPDLDGLRYDSGSLAAERLAAWEEGRTGYPIVDAGMRQLRTEGWLPNRVRMVVASFLVKDLHLPWTAGARWFMARLVDGDLASNAHGWQWVAGTGTDAAPYFRVFNPVGQGRRFDPDGAYVRRHVPELAGVAGAAVHEPWTLPSGVPAGYPQRMVDHVDERREALARYAASRRP